MEFPSSWFWRFGLDQKAWTKLYIWHFRLDQMPYNAKNTDIIVTVSRRVKNQTYRPSAIYKVHEILVHLYHNGAMIILMMERATQYY
jgi:hypothetical protein